MENQQIVQEFKNVISELQAAIEKIGAEQANILEEWQQFTHNVKTTHHQTIETFKKSIDQYEQALQEKQKIIEGLVLAVMALKFFKPWVLIKDAIRPRLYLLNQYKPKNLHFPKKYANTVKCKKTPTISIVTPSYNQGKYLEETIKSVIEQHYPALEYIIQDNASTDNSVEIIKRYEKKLRFWESNKDKNQANAVNLGFKHATGEIMAYLNSDDILLPGSLAYIAHYFETHPKVDVVYGHRVIINEQNKEIGRWVLPPHDINMLIWADYVPQETLFWRRRIWEKAGGYMDESFQFALDWDLLLRFKAAGAIFARLPRFLGGFRFHAEQKTSSEMSTIGNQEMDILRKRCHGKEVSVKMVKKNIRKYLLKHIIFHKLYKIGWLQY